MLNIFFKSFYLFRCVGKMKHQFLDFEEILKLILSLNIQKVSDAMNESYASLGYPAISSKDEWRKIMETHSGELGEFGIILDQSPNGAIEEMKARAQRCGKEIFAMHFQDILAGDYVILNYLVRFRQ